MDEPIKPIDQEDVFLWPCGTWCWRYELPQYGHMSDDYETLGAGGQRWLDHLTAED